MGIYGNSNINPLSDVFKNHNLNKAVGDAIKKFWNDVREMNKSSEAKGQEKEIVDFMAKCKQALSKLLSGDIQGAKKILAELVKSPQFDKLTQKAQDSLLKIDKLAGNVGKQDQGPNLAVNNNSNNDNDNGDPFKPGLGEIV